jgi:hypothetical protein
MRQPSLVNMGFDATGKRLAFLSEDGGRADLLELPSRRLLGHLANFAENIGPEGKLWGRPQSGYALFPADSDAPLVTLGIDSLVTSVQSPFSMDGNRVAWGSADGSVTVCDLPEVQKRLDAIGLGW